MSQLPSSVTGQRLLSKSQFFHDVREKRGQKQQQQLPSSLSAKNNVYCYYQLKVKGRGGETRTRVKCKWKYHVIPQNHR